MNVKEYIKQESDKRFFNKIFCLFYVILGFLAISTPAMLLVLLPVFIMQCFTNVAFIICSQELSASDSEIIEAGINAPLWFKKKFKL